MHDASYPCGCAWPRTETVHRQGLRKLRNNDKTAGNRNQLWTERGEGQCQSRGGACKAHRAGKGFTQNPDAAKIPRPRPRKGKRGCHHGNLRRADWGKCQPDSRAGKSDRHDGGHEKYHHQSQPPCKNGAGDLPRYPEQREAGQARHRADCWPHHRIRKPHWDQAARRRGRAPAVRRWNTDGGNRKF